LLFVGGVVEKGHQGSGKKERMMSRPLEIDVATVQNKLRQIQSNSTSGSQQMALWVVANLILSTGLKLKEITDLKAGDVFVNNNIVNQITVNRQRPISRPTSHGSPLRIVQPGRPKSIQLALPQNIRTLLNSYVQGLRSGMASPITGSSPLFRTYSGDSGKRKLTNHLYRYETYFNELRRAGVIHFYTECCRNDPDHNRKKVSERAIKSAVGHFQMEERNVEDYLKGIHRPAGRRKGERRTLDDRGADLVLGLRSTGYEIFVEDKVSELVTEMEELFGDSVDAKNIEAKRIYLKWLYEMVSECNLPHAPSDMTSSAVIQRSEPPQSSFDEQLMIKNKPEYSGLRDLKKMIFDLIEERKRGLNNGQIQQLKSFHDELQKKRMAERKELAKGRRYPVSLHKLSKSEFREWVSRMQKDGEKEYKRWLKTPEIKSKREFLKSWGKSSLGKGIRKWREQQNLQQVDLAGKIGVKKNTVVNWEQGKTKPTKKKLEKMEKMGFKPSRRLPVLRIQKP
jgi:DNA-binding transcriptional regulator YiaG